MQIRAYCDDDFSALCRIFQRAVREIASQHYSPAQINAWAQVDDACWRQKMADSLVLVATVDETPVGFVTAVERYIDLLFVDPSYARQGVASALLNALFARVPTGALTVESSITAKACFERLGFVVLAEQEVEARGETFVNYRMEKIR
ncbi:MULTISPECIES: GNAT family N-acetyltransferase [Enterobacteriaceae]|uniref:GNAT family N-acetyltransferase n=1 Tax=Enterobacteriaceae TaxID=543 RepID=UPI001D10A22F|nr:GNAT family N-acetyltransferase [Klebsiella sp. WP8-S18-ESBL-06]